MIRVRNSHNGVLQQRSAPPPPPPPPPPPAAGGENAVGFFRPASRFIFFF